MATIGRHRRHVSCLHDDAGERFSGIAVIAAPMDLVTHLEELFDTIVPVNDWQDVFLGGGTHEAVFDHRGEGRIPGDLGAGQVEGMHFIFKTGLGVELRRVLRNIGKGPVDWCTADTLRKGKSPRKPTQRWASSRVRVMAGRLSPCLRP